MGETVEALASLGNSITSPAKLAFVGYVVLAYAGKIGTSTCQFIAVALVFFFLQISHDDCLRYALNAWGLRLGKWGNR
jgi:hypothetical protein